MEKDDIDKLLEHTIRFGNTKAPDSLWPKIEKQLPTKKKYLGDFFNAYRIAASIAIIVSLGITLYFVNYNINEEFVFNDKLSHNDELPLSKNENISDSIQINSKIESGQTIINEISEEINEKESIFVSNEIEIKEELSEQFYADSASIGQKITKSNINSIDVTQKVIINKTPLEFYMSKGNSLIKIEIPQKLMIKSRSDFLIKVFSSKDEKLVLQNDVLIDSKIVDNAELFEFKILTKLNNGYYFYTIYDKKDEKEVMVGSFYLKKME